MPIFEDDQVGSNRVQPERLPRPVVSTLDTWDQNTQVDYPTSAGHSGRRLGWNIPSIAVTSEPINTIRTSANTRFQGVRQATKAGFHPNPSTNSPAYKVLPNMAQNIQVDAPVQVQFSVNVTSAASGATPYFAVFRDGVKISQEYRQQTMPNVYSLVTGTLVDPNPPKGWHTYDLRWHVDPVGGGTLTAENKNRTFQASNQRAT